MGGDTTQRVRRQPDHPQPCFGRSSPEDCNHRAAASVKDQIAEVTSQELQKDGTE